MRSNYVYAELINNGGKVLSFLNSFFSVCYKAMGLLKDSLSEVFTYKMRNLNNF